MNDRFDDLFPNNDEFKTEVVDDEFESQYAQNETPSADTVFNTPYGMNSDAVSQPGYNSAQWGGDAQYSEPYPQYNEQPQPYTDNYANPYSNPTLPKKNKEKKPMSASFVAGMLVVCILLSSVVGFAGALLYTKHVAKNTEISDNGALIINKAEIDEKTAEKLSDKPTSQITNEVADTVVEITTEQVSINQFYGQYVTEGAGSGVIISTDGYIITNNHVIENASSITVTLRDETTYEAELVGTDSVLDVALIKIDANNLHAATFGDSDKLKVGDKAVAIGNPLGQLGGTVTDGIISALDRDVVVGEETMSLLQTDSAINPGNSGGGLFDGQGQLIGLVVAKSSGEEIEGLGFAIPINDVVEVIDDLKEYHYVRGRVTTGMELVDLSNSLYASIFFGSNEAGCYVHAVEEGSSAYYAGIQVNDRIVSVNGTEVASSADVEKALDNAKVGDVVTFEIERGSQVASVDITLEEYIPDEFAQSADDGITNPFE